MDGILDGNKCAVVGKPAWHLLGDTYPEGEFVSAKRAFDSMGGAFELRKEQAAIWSVADNAYVPVPDRFAIVRGATAKSNKEVVFDFVTDGYHIVQPSQLVDAFDEKVRESIETLGFISDGRKMFLTWRLPKLVIGEVDEVDLFGQVMFGFDGVFSSRVNIGSVRIVCANTFSMALGEEKVEKEKNRGRGNIYTGKHSNKNLLNEIGIWMGYVQQNAKISAGLVGGFFKKLAETPIHHERQALDLISATWPNPAPVSAWYPSELKVKKEEKIEAEREKMEEIRDGVMNCYETKSDELLKEDTYWRLFNAGTYYFNHVQKSKKDTAYSIVFGNRSAEMNKFGQVLMNDIYG